MHSSTSHAYDELLAGLPADPAMAGLLEPLVLPAEAYQIPPGLQNGTDQLLQTETSLQMPEQQQPMLAPLDNDGDQGMSSVSFEEHAPSATAPQDVAEQPQYGLQTLHVPNASTADCIQVMGQQQQQQQLCWEQPQQLQSSQQAHPDPEIFHAVNVQTRQQPGTVAMQHEIQGPALTHAPRITPVAEAQNALSAQSAAVITDASKWAASDKVYLIPQTVAPSGNAMLAMVNLVYIHGRLVYMHGLLHIACTVNLIVYHTACNQLHCICRCIEPISALTPLPGLGTNAWHECSCVSGCCFHWSSAALHAYHALQV